MSRQTLEGKNDSSLLNPIPDLVHAGCHDLNDSIHALRSACFVSSTQHDPLTQLTTTTTTTTTTTSHHALLS
ncbi:hypothetical protein CBS147320_1777 [Aspergillus niger]|nr:hypothetical protein CBS13152_1579 [Aspergillus niger]KAI2933258.1 hypothetical protein CBS147320_1777 [Aspergillus niger]KAI3055022.1 hypothetical protein CBS147352_3315 [Aspergillus niger]